MALAPRRHGAPRHGAPRLGLWLRLAGLSAGWLACRLSAGFRLEFRLDFGSGLASVGFWLDLAFIHQDFGWIWLDFGWIWLDLEFHFGLIRLDFGWIRVLIALTAL